MKNYQPSIEVFRSLCWVIQEICGSNAKGIILNGLATVAALRIIGSIWKKPRDKMSFWEDMLFGALGVVIAEVCTNI
jgi:hypothetical protein